MSLAQDEIDRLLSQTEKSEPHPEDLAYKLDNESDDNDDKEFTEKGGNRIHTGSYRRRLSEDSDNDDDTDYSKTMLSKPTPYHVPNTVFDANTGPKGVIADAQSFERAKKRSFRRTIMDAASFDYRAMTQSRQPMDDQRNNNKRGSSPGSNPQSGEESGNDDERFMRQWRETRMRELQGKDGRRPSPSKRRYGTVETVSATGYLDAVEKVTSETVVVVCIYDPESTESSIVEDALTTIARKHSTTRFVKLHHEIAEMDHINAPALLAYKNGEVFSTIINVLQQIPNGRGCSSASLGDLLMQNRIL